MVNNLTSVRYKNPHGICVICRAIFAEQKSESLYLDGKNLKNLCHLWEINKFFRVIRAFRVR